MYQCTLDVLANVSGNLAGPMEMYRTTVRLTSARRLWSSRVYTGTMAPGRLNGADAVGVRIAETQPILPVAPPTTLQKTLSAQDTLRGPRTLEANAMRSTWARASRQQASQ